MKNNKYLCGIVGHPLTKPRSVEIWGKYFKRKKINSSMQKFDVHPDEIKNFIKKIRNNKNFLAMAVTMPYKKELTKHMDYLDGFSRKTNSINLVVKKNNNLSGHNTDIYGAFSSIKKNLNKFNEIIIIGMGGTGQAIFNFLYNTYKKKKFYLISRKFDSKKRVKVYKKLDKKLLIEKKLIINCTPLGSDLKRRFKNKTPINKNLFSSINKKTLIFDIVYSPLNTVLSKICKLNKIKYINGIKMNTLQAKKSLQIIFE